MENNEINSKSEAIRQLENVYLTVAHHLNMVCSRLADCGLLEANNENDILLAIQDVNADNLDISKVLESGKDTLDISRLVDYIIDQKDEVLFQRLIIWYPYKNYPHDFILGIFCSEDYTKFASVFETELERLDYNTKMVFPDNNLPIGNKTDWKLEDYERKMSNLKTSFKKELDRIWEMNMPVMNTAKLVFGIPEPSLWEECNSIIKNKFGWMASALFPNIDFSSNADVEKMQPGFSPGINKVLQKAIKAKLIQKQDNGLYHWNGTRKLLSFFGYCFYSHELVEHQWKLMEKMFGTEATKNIAQTFSKHYCKKYTAQTEEEKKIDKLFNI